MGQSSSSGSKNALPANNLLIDASDSYITELKLKNTEVIPISEYIKKDKYNKNIQRLQNKDNTPEVQKGTKSKDKDEDTASNETSTETINKEKKLFLESSFEDIPSKRKWINSNNSTSNPQHFQSKSTDKNHHKNQKTQTFRKESIVEKEEEIRQLYKNRIYPHIYTNKYNRNAEHKQKEKYNKGKPPVSSDSQICFSDTEIRKKTTQKPKHHTRYEESTHQLNQHQHHYYRAKPANTTPKQNKFSVQTNVSCVIHPDRRKQAILVSSEEILRRRPPPKKYFIPPADSSSYLTYPRYTYTSTQTTPIQFQRKDNTLDKVTKDHRKFLSARQALENWKNIHTIKQHRKNSNTSYNNYQEDIYRYNNRLPSYEERNYEYFPSRHVRSRAGSRESDYKLSPLEISNYNYSKQPKYFKTRSISPTEIRERNKNMQQRVFREYMPEYNPPDSPRYNYVENTSYGRYPLTSNKYQNYEEERNFYRYSPRPEFSDWEIKAMEREDFIEEMERCLQKKIASVHGGRNMGCNRPTWVKDKYRRWHKVSM